jgi:HTH-type transcriptional regulator/antitoxin HigA
MKDYNETLSRIETLMDIENPDRKVINEIELLATRIELYENEKWRINAPDPIDAVRFRMEQQGLTQNDLIP